MRINNTQSLKPHANGQGKDNKIKSNFSYYEAALISEILSFNNLLKFKANE